MRTLYGYLIVVFFNSCSYQETDFYSCADSKGLFGSEYSYHISLDTITNYKVFEAKTEKICDTMDQCTLWCGFFYNLLDSNFNASSNPSNNIFINAFEIMKKSGCAVDYASPTIEIFVNDDDSIIIYDYKNRKTLGFQKQNNDFIKRIDEFYYDFFNQGQDRDIMYIKFVVSDSVDFETCFLPYLKVMLNSYRSHFEDFLANNHIDICDTLFLNNSSSRTKLSYSFNLRLYKYYESDKLNAP